MSCIYVTYDVNMRNFLNDNGLRYILCGLNPNSHDMFWAFERTEKLNMFVKSWIQNKR